MLEGCKAKEIVCPAGGNENKNNNFRENVGNI